jgi:hypothetical protein
MSIDCLPKDVALSLLVSWLRLKDLLYLDTALCNRVSRDWILQIYREKGFSFEGRERQLPSLNFDQNIPLLAKWAFSRRTMPILYQNLPNGSDFQGLRSIFHEFIDTKQIFLVENLLKVAEKLTDLELCLLNINWIEHERDRLANSVEYDLMDPDEEKVLFGDPERITKLRIGCSPDPSALYLNFQKHCQQIERLCKRFTHLERFYLFFGRFEAQLSRSNYADILKLLSEHCPKINQIDMFLDMAPLSDAEFIAELSKFKLKTFKISGLKELPAEHLCKLTQAWGEHLQSISFGADNTISTCAEAFGCIGMHCPNIEELAITHSNYYKLTGGARGLVEKHLSPQIAQVLTFDTCFLYLFVLSTCANCFEFTFYYVGHPRLST